MSDKKSIDWKMIKLLMMTRKVDKKDTSSAGFTYDWVSQLNSKLKTQNPGLSKVQGPALSKVQGSKLFVICQEKGDIAGLEEVGIYSLGKEKGFSKLKQFFTFQKLALKLMPQIDGVFCHQNPEYTILIAPWAKLFGQKIVAWYTHKAVNWKLHLVNCLADKILTASAESCRLKNRKKIEVVGHGIDTEKFKVQSSKFKNKDKFKILSVGRISPVKDYQTLIGAIEVLVKYRWVENLAVQIIGGPGLLEDEKYFDQLKQLVRDKDLENQIKFLGPIPHHQIVPYYQHCHLFINLSQTGSIDKAVLEAMACQKLVLTSNEAFVDILNDERLLFDSGNQKEVADKITNLMNLSTEEKQAISRQLREQVVKNHNLDNLAAKIVKQFL